MATHYKGKLRFASHCRSHDLPWSHHGLSSSTYFEAHLFFFLASHLLNNFHDRFVIQHCEAPSSAASAKMLAHTSACSSIHTISYRTKLAPKCHENFSIHSAKLLDENTFAKYTLKSLCSLALVVWQCVQIARGVTVETNRRIAS